MHFAKTFDRIARWSIDNTKPWHPFVRAVELWTDAEGARMAAAMSFYGILSLAPLLILIVALLGWWIDRATLEQGLVAQIGTVVGQDGAGVLRGALSSAKEPAQGVLASVLGFGILLFGATGVFGELQAAMERLWWHGRGKPSERRWWYSASLRLRGVAYVLAFGFLLLVSLTISTLLNLFAGWADNLLALEQVLMVLNEAVAYAICAGLFVGLMRLSVGPKPPLRDLVFGACVGATLFTVGRHLLAAYLSSAAVVSAYGAAGSLVVLLMWIFFASALLLFSAGCARALEESRRDARARAHPAVVDGSQEPLWPEAPTARPER